MADYYAYKTINSIEYGFKLDEHNHPFATVLNSDTWDNVITVESHIDGVPVTVIGEYAFRHCRHINDAILPDTIAIIEPSAFEASGIRSITIPDSVTKIGSFAFHDCKNLEKINFGNGLKCISNCAFASCNKLKEIIFPASLETLFLSAVEACEKLEHIHFDGDCFEFNDGDYMGLAYKCPELKYITTSPSNTRYVAVDNVLYDYKKKSLVRIPQASKSTNFTLPKWVEHCENNSFFNIPKLKTVTVRQKDIKNFQAAGWHTTHITKFRCDSSSNVGQIIKKKHIDIFEASSNLNDFLDDIKAKSEDKNI